MKRYLAAVSLVALVLVGTPCHAQKFLQKLENVLGNQQGQGFMPGQQTQPVGNVNLPPGQYMMTNTQSGQAFYVIIQSGQMYLTAPSSNTPYMPGQNGGGYPPVYMPGQNGSGLPPVYMPGQNGSGLAPNQGGVGGLIKNGLGNFLQNQMNPQPQQQQFPDQ